MARMGTDLKLRRYPSLSPLTLATFPSIPLIPSGPFIIMNTNGAAVAAIYLPRPSRAMTRRRRVTVDGTASDSENNLKSVLSA